MSANASAQPETPVACSQQGCQEQEDILRPYCHLDYAWDEPSLPHKIVLALPGNLLLGSYALDKVCCPLSKLGYLMLALMPRALSGTVAGRLHTMP